MANTSVDGLISGLDTTTIISQLMQIEAQSQTRLKTQVTNETGTVTAYQAINAALKAATDKAKSLDTASDWKVYSATSSTTSVAATASASATAGTYSFDVKTLAASHKVLYSTAAAKTAIVAGSTIDISVNGTIPAVSVPVGDGSLQGVVDGINGQAGLGVKAGLVKVADGSFRLQLTSASTGAASKFIVSGLTGLGTGTITSTGADASIQIGPDAVNDVITSSSNTFSDVFPGVTFTVSSVQSSTDQSGVTLTVGTDNGTLQTSIKSMVDSLNAALAEITKDTAYDPATKKGGALLGQLLPRQLQDSLRSSVFSTTGGSLATVGIQLDSTGKFTLDETKLAAALKADPVLVTSLVSGFAARVGDVAGKASASGGAISSVIDGRNTLIKTLNDQISDWDTRLVDRQTALKKQYSGLELALQKLKSQGDYLAGQIASLPTYNNNN
jgi:flagellar hook-associated protein 2